MPCLLSEGESSPSLRRSGLGQIATLFAFILMGTTIVKTGVIPRDAGMKRVAQKYNSRVMVNQAM